VFVCLSQCLYVSAHVACLMIWAELPEINNNKRMNGRIVERWVDQIFSSIRQYKQSDRIQNIASSSRHAKFFL